MEYEKKLVANANPGDDMKDMFAASKQTGLQVSHQGLYKLISTCLLQLTGGQRHKFPRCTANQF